MPVRWGAYAIRPAPSVLSISARNDEQLVRFTWRSKRFLRSLSPSRSANETSPMSSVSLWPFWKRLSQYVATSVTHGPIKSPSSFTTTRSPERPPSEILTICCFPLFPLGNGTDATGLPIRRHRLYSSRNPQVQRDLIEARQHATRRRALEISWKGDSSIHARGQNYDILWVKRRAPAPRREESLRILFTAFDWLLGGCRVSSSCCGVCWGGG